MSPNQIQFRAVVESSPAAITTGVEGRYVYLNPAAVRLFGAKSADELIGQPVIDRVHPDYKHVAMERMLQIHEGKSSEPLEQIYLRLDGSPVDVEVYGVPFQAGERHGAVAFIRDISERKMAQAVLRRHAERHDTMLATTGDGFWITDPADARILEVNDAFCRMSGYAREELLNMRIPDIEAAESPEETAQHLRRIIETGFDRFETKHRRKDGTIYEAEILASHWASEKKLLVFQRDITAQKKGEAELARSRELMLALEVSRAVSEAMGMGVIGLDAGHHVLFANPVAEELLDVTENEMRGRKLDQLVRAANAQGTQLDPLPFWPQVDKGLPFQMEEWTFARRDRSRFPVSLVIAPLPADLAPTGSVLSFQDISVRRQARQALLDADRRKNQFLAMLAHELRNPLTPIRNAAFVLGRLDVNEPKLKWAQEVIEGQVRHLSRLTDELLDVSRIAQGKIELRKESIEAGALIAQLTAVAGPMFEARNQSLGVRLPERPAWLNGDVVRLTQVISNLLDNASKYTQAGGKIDVIARAAGHELELKVSDNGPGITADLLPHVFDLFQQGERTLDRAEGGLGIGLTLVRQLVTMHGGRVFAHSRGPGEGATFTVRLPLVDAAAAVVQSATPRAHAAKAALPRGGRVLLVEDEAAVRDSMVQLLDLAGCDVATAANGEAALAQAESVRPQLVLLDIGLKGMDGFEIARRLRRLPNGNDMVVIAVTGYADEATRRHALESGCDHHMGKPVDPGRLLEIVHSALRRPQDQDRHSLPVA